MKRSLDFYVNVLGFVEGDRPPFAFSGYWLYCGKTPVVHVSGEALEWDGLQGNFGERSGGAGLPDHIAVSAADLEGEGRLDRLGARYTARSVPLPG